MLSGAGYQKFDPEKATVQEIIEFSSSLKGKALRDVLPASGALREGAPSDKGAVGQLVERAFGLPRSSEQRPDFRAAGVELKVVPLKRTKREVRAKERTNVSMIDYFALPRETWTTAKVRNKLQHVLFVFYFHVDAASPMDAVIEEVVLWSPDESLAPQLERDWTVVRDKVAAGMAHEISESDGRVLGAATKGAGGGKLVDQPHNSQARAKPRAWALKPALTSWIYQNERAEKRESEVSLEYLLKVRKGADFEATVLRRLVSYSGRSLASIAGELGISIGRAKSSAALLVRHAIGVTNDRVRIREFEQRGIEIKTVPVSEAGRPWEAMSFPKFNHMQVIHEEWEHSDLLSRLSRLLIVPLVRPARDTPKEESLWGIPFFWSPNYEQLRGIESEWRDYVSRIARGQSNQLPGYSATRFIHVRPHGRDKTDTEPAPMLEPQVKKSFWLNPGFMAQVIVANGGLLRIREPR